MNKVNYTLRNFEKSKPRIYKGDNLRIKKVCEILDAETLKRDGFVKYGVNKAIAADAIRVSLDCFLNSLPDGQTTLFN